MVNLRLWGDFQTGLTEIGRLCLKVGDFIAWAGVLDQIERRKGGEHTCLSLCFLRVSGCLTHLPAAALSLRDALDPQSGSQNVPAFLKSYSSEICHSNENSL